MGSYPIFVSGYNLEQDVDARFEVVHSHAVNNAVWLVHSLYMSLNFNSIVVAKIDPLLAALKIRSADLNQADCAIYPLSQTDWLWIFIFVPLQY